MNSNTMHTVLDQKIDGAPSARTWFAGGERVGYNPKARAIVAGQVAPLKIFLKREGDLAHPVSRTIRIPPQNGLISLKRFGARIS
jgi:hypothetical protein